MLPQRKTTVTVIILLFGLGLTGLWATKNPVQAKQNPAIGNLGTWETAASPVSYNFLTIAMTSPTNGWIGGLQGYSVNGYSLGPTLLHWNGSQWTEQTVTLQSANLIFDALAVIAPDDIWLSGGNAGCSTAGVFYHWNGAAWAGGVLVSSHINAIQAGPNGKVWAAGKYCTPAAGMKYTSGPALYGLDGLNWNGTVVNQQTGYSISAGFRAMDIDPDNNVWVTYGAAIQRYDSTGNNPVDYYPVNPGYKYFMAIDMLTSSDGWAGGENGMIQHWDGTTWTAASSPTSQTIRSIDLVTSQDGWAVGSAGTILHWDGVSWSAAASPATTALYAISMLSSNEGWAVGEGGAILHYTNIIRTFLPMLSR